MQSSALRRDLLFESAQLQPGPNRQRAEDHRPDNPNHDDRLLTHRP